MEIERKFLVTSIPENIEKYEKHEIEQGYISTEPVIRIRRLDEKLILTVKSKGLLSRQEFELELDAGEYRNLSEKVSGNLIRKTRYKIPLPEGYTIELDIFHGDFDGLCYAEVEFPDEDTAKKFNPPAYFSREVTYEPQFHNSSLSSMDKPSIFGLISKIRETCG